jgi:para-aminobenzoate synthetase component 1
MTNRQQKSFPLENTADFIEKSLHWANGSSHCSYFNPNDVPYPFDPFEHFIAIGCHQEVCFDGIADFEKLKQECESNKEWLIGYLSYDLKNQLEQLESTHPDRNGFHPIYFYIPEHLIHFHHSHVVISSHGDPEEVYQLITQSISAQITDMVDISITANVSKEQYLKTVKTILQHIVDGDVYELNYCMEFYAERVTCSPLSLYKQLMQFSPTPFSVFQKIGDQYLIGASPERFMKKINNKLISQPIKGTIRRGENSEEDVILQYQLKHSEKERAENMMIVDLVRNDLAKSCTPGSVKVEEMFGIYPFKHLHQMISSISGELNPAVHLIDAIKNAFPMGSMTGAPKVMAMKLIEQYETSKRGLFSGAVGYITPEGAYDFNVVIRSVFYNAKTKVLSFQVGSAITYDSDPEQEYKECLLKAKAIQQVLNIDVNQQAKQHRDG